jgi:hypothetical protein
MDRVRFQEFKDPRLHSYLLMMLRAEARLNEVDRAVQKYHRGSVTTGVPATDFDFCFLQFRFSLELICKALIYLNSSLGVQFPKDVLEKRQGPDKLLKALVKAAPDFYPVCVCSRMGAETGLKIEKVDPQPLPYEEFAQYCRNRFSTLLHGRRDGRQNFLGANFDQIQIDQEKIRRQFQYHIAKIKPRSGDIFVRTKIGNDMCSDFADRQIINKLKVF